MIQLLRKFTRITNSDKFIPEVDGLRFVAIIWVVLFHLNGFIINKTSVHELDTRNVLNWLLSNGEQGVELFFVISGFVVTLPFVKRTTEINFNIRAYYIRRLWRLVPPCMIVTILLFFMHLFVVKKYSIAELSANLLTSSVYISTLVFPDRLPLINPVTWSLEVEMQFYLIAPFFLKYVFSKQKFKDRVLIYILLFVISFLLKILLNTHLISLLGYVHYFVAGILLCDIYKNDFKIKIINNKNAWVYSIICLFLILFLKIRLYVLLDMVYPILILIFCYTILINKTFPARVLKYDFLVIIGGMCYTIYLIHYSIISIVGNQLIKMLDFHNYFTNFISITIVILPFILILSICFFRLFERPFMKFPNRLLKYVE